MERRNTSEGSLELLCQYTDTKKFIKVNIVVYEHIQIPLEVNFDQLISIFMEEFNIKPEINESIAFKYLEDEDEIEYITVRSDFDLNSNRNEIFIVHTSSSSSGKFIGMKNILALSYMI